jgi:hypothetical protein
MITYNEVDQNVKGDHPNGIYDDSDNNTTHDTYRVICAYKSQVMMMQYNLYLFHFLSSSLPSFCPRLEIYHAPDGIRV